MHTDAERFDLSFSPTGFQTPVLLFRSAKTIMPPPPPTSLSSSLHVTAAPRLAAATAAAAAAAVTATLSPWKMRERAREEMCVFWGEPFSLSHLNRSWFILLS